MFLGPRHFVSHLQSQGCDYEFAEIDKKKCIVMDDSVFNLHVALGKSSVSFFSQGGTSFG